jgi:hypothetical protein
MKAIEKGFGNAINENVVTGLIGEIIFILATNNPSKTFDYWHNSISDAYDFSGENFRLDIKTCQSMERIHTFLLQIPGKHPEKTYIASIQISRVANGETFVSLIDRLFFYLSPQQQKTAMQIILDTIKVPVQMVLIMNLIMNQP